MVSAAPAEVGIISVPFVCVSVCVFSAAGFFVHCAHFANPSHLFALLWEGELGLLPACVLCACCMFCVCVRVCGLHVSCAFVCFGVV